MNIWFASGNEHKRQEIAAILPNHTVRIPKDAGINFDPEENGSSFLENALIKARSLYAVVREPVLADDSGLCVDALNGRPGIFSARYGSESGGNGGGKLSASERNARLLAEIGNARNRKARFICAMALFFAEDRFVIAQETLEGEIIREERGRGGFGYDPLLYLPEKGRTVAELSEAEKNAISHRGKAAALIARLLENG